jgi:hypothetical protein
MRTTFTVRNRKYDLVLEKREPGEGEKNHPYTATVSGENGGPVRGTLQFTPGAIEAAQKRATEKGEKGDSVDSLLTSGGAKSLAAEVLIRKLKADFSFIVDHRWVA